MEWMAIILSGISLISTAIAYLCTDRKLKQQQLLLNEYALQKQKIEECELKSAKIEAVGRGENGMSYFVVKNVGKSTARNVRFSLNDNLSLGINPFPLAIMSPADSVRVVVSLGLSDPVSTFGTFTWEDDLGRHSSVHVLSFS